MGCDTNLPIPCKNHRSNLETASSSLLKKARKAIDKISSDPFGQSLDRQEHLAVQIRPDVKPLDPKSNTSGN